MRNWWPPNSKFEFRALIVLPPKNKNNPRFLIFWFLRRPKVGQVHLTHFIKSWAKWPNLPGCTNCTPDCAIRQPNQTIPKSVFYLSVQTNSSRSHCGFIIVNPVNRELRTCVKREIFSLAYGGKTGANDQPATEKWTRLLADWLTEVYPYYCYMWYDTSAR